MNATRQVTGEKFSYTSDIAGDVWHPKTNPEAFEWWYFDALSEDGRDAVVIIFLDNFIFSPRYNAFNRKSKFFVKKNPRSQSAQTAQAVPAIAFTYYRDGKPIYRAINEFPAEDFSASENTPSCHIGGNFFRLDSAPYGIGYLLSINAVLRNNLKLEAHFEWLLIEGNFLPEKKLNVKNSHSWNLAVARADVTGRISVSNAQGKLKNIVHFRGTGYHDHNFDNRWLPKTVEEWHWGRVHFADSSAVFYRYKELGHDKPTVKLFTVRAGELRDRDAIYEEQDFKRDKFGIKYPLKLEFVTKDGMRLIVNQSKVIDSSFFYLRFLSEITLTLRDGKSRNAVGLTEYLAPRALKYKWLDWLINMRIGRRGKGSFLP